MNLLGTAFAEALDNVPQPPCEGCGHSVLCGSDRLACGDFMEYVETGEVRREMRIPCDGIYAKCFPKKDSVLSHSEGRKNPVNASQQKKRTCQVCNTTYTGIYENFGYKNGRVCKHCREGGYNPLEKMKKSKVCVSCGEEKFGLTKHFRQTSIPGSDGRVKVYRDVCKVCEGRYVSLVA